MIVAVVVPLVECVCEGVGGGVIVLDSEKVAVGVSEGVGGGVIVALRVAL